MAIEGSSDISRTPENPNSGDRLKKDCQNLLTRNVEFTENTGERGLINYQKGEFPDSYRTLGLEYRPKHTPVKLADIAISTFELPKVPAFDDPEEEGKPPFLDRDFTFTVSQRRDIHPDLEALPEIKITVPIDSRVHYGYGRIEYYTDADGSWKAVEYDKRPFIEALEQNIRGSEEVDYLKEVGKLVTTSQDIEANGELEKTMGVAREVDQDEIIALGKLMQDPLVLADRPGRFFTGIIKDLDTTEGRDRQGIIREKENKNPSSEDN